MLRASRCPVKMIMSKNNQHDQVVAAVEKLGGSVAASTPPVSCEDSGSRCEPPGVLRGGMRAGNRQAVMSVSVMWCLWDSGSRCEPPGVLWGGMRAGNRQAVMSVSVMWCLWDSGSCCEPPGVLRGGGRRCEPPGVL